MKNTVIVDGIVEGLIHASKTLLKDKYIQKQKVPFFTQNKAQSINNVFIEQAGYQIATRKRYSHLDLSMDRMPLQNQTDSLASKSVRISHQHQQMNRSLKFSNFKNKRLVRSQNKRQKEQINPIAKYQTSQLQKQNKLVKVPEFDDGKIVLLRVKKREQQQQQRQRQQKRKQLIQQYEKQRSMQLFHHQRQEQKNRLKYCLDKHMAHDKNAKFTFGVDGEILLFKEDPQKICKKNYPPELIDYNIEESNQNQNQLESKFTRHQQSNQKQQRRYRLTQNQRIKSARGQAFASSVLKTVNLSKMSMNRTTKDVDAEQFMKRNDLFNNNHSRQTTSIPYMEAQEGTFYKQLGTNQVISWAQEQENKTEKDTRENSIKTQSYFRRSSNCEIFPSTKNSKRDQKQSQKKDRKYNQEVKIQARKIKTSQRYFRSAKAQLRPSTSFHNGRITKTNVALALNILQ